MLFIRSESLSLAHTQGEEAVFIHIIRLFLTDLFVPFSYLSDHLLILVSLILAILYFGLKSNIILLYKLFQLGLVGAL